MDRINEIWPKWHTEEPIGQGAYGRVFKVRREELGEVFYSAFNRKIPGYLFKVFKERTEFRIFAGKHQKTDTGTNGTHHIPEKSG